MADVVVIGGGLAGLINAILLNRGGLKVILLEQKQYPFQRVCGEYISNEVLPFMEAAGLLQGLPEMSQINRLQLTSINGDALESELDLGGFGLSRYLLDEHLARMAQKEGIELRENSKVEALHYKMDYFEVSLKGGQTISAPLAVAAFGKRSVLDRFLQRGFLKLNSPWVGVKYHLRWNDFPPNLIALHNFYSGYCGVSRIEDNKINMCYLTHRDNLKKYKNIRLMEESVLMQNPFLNRIYREAEFLLDPPVVINEISFQKKEPVLNHLLMCGDSAGMIAPLCGNGMAMAIHAAKILSEVILRYYKPSGFDRRKLEKDYEEQWKKLFSGRLYVGRKVQKLFGGNFGSRFAVSLGKFAPPVFAGIMKKTHGLPF